VRETNKSEVLKSSNGWPPYVRVPVCGVINESQHKETMRDMNCQEEKKEETAQKEEENKRERCCEMIGGAQPLYIKTKQ
jgi:hypothetical protein